MAHIQIDQSNAAQLSAWDGQDGSYWAARADRFDEGVAAYLEPFFVAAAIEPQDWQPTQSNPWMFFGSDVDDAGEFNKGQFAWMLDNLDERSRIKAIDTLRAALAGHLTDDGICYDSCTWLIEATAAS
ncbi:MAG: hypothetical protein ACR2M5_10860, partial [Nakamurella sp.]